MSNIPLDQASSASASAAVKEERDSLVDALVEEMVTAWKNGLRPLAESYFSRLPALREEDVVRLVFEEVWLRQEYGEEAISGEILARFPQYRSRLEVLLDCNRLLRLPPPIEYPEVGDELGDFRLLAEIGRGALGRTFLASQRSLAHRLMVLKVTPLGQEEHLSLARLQHMNIMPLYFEQVVADRALRVLGMPYLGGATLARILDSVRSIPVSQRTGAHVLEAIDRSAVTVATEQPVERRFRKSLAQKQYIHVICSFGACLADALQYAHERGLVHLDVKPSNVLIGGDCQPLLLDFHLAQGPILPDDPAPERLGGTPGYLSPEQLAAMAAIRAGGRLKTAVDGRSDIYSLGVLLYEALGGEMTKAGARGGGSLARSNPKVSPGLSDIVDKCLARDPADRYLDAGALALDLRLHISDLPLKGVVNRSVRERWRKQRRRNPAALTKSLFRLATVVAMIGVAGYWIVGMRRTHSEIKDALGKGREHLNQHRYDEAASELEKGRSLTSKLFDDVSLSREFDSTLQRLKRTRRAAALHELVDALRFRFGVEPPSAEESESLVDRGRELWEGRDLLMKPGDEPLPPAIEAQVRSDLVDLATVWADLRVNIAPGRQTTEALEDAFHVLLDAEKRFGPSPALSRDLRNYGAELKKTDVQEIDLPEPKTAWEHYDLGRYYLRSGKFARAEPEFRRAIELNPGEFWPYFSAAACEFKLGHYNEALTSFTVCVALFPRSAESYFNRAVVHEELGQVDQAVADYTKALEWNPRLTDAALNRGILALRSRQFVEAARDFRLARGASAVAPSALAGKVHFDGALIHLSRSDWPSARASFREAAANGNAAALRLAARIDLEQQ